MTCFATRNKISTKVSAIVYVILFGAVLQRSISGALGACTASQFQCDSGQCIPASWKCDFDSDCFDSSDEANSTCHDLLKCSDSEFQCANQQQCVPVRWKCDGESDCSDGSDEEQFMCSNFTCNIDQFTCIEGSSKKCLPLTWVCDGTPDCQNESDEKACNATCTSNEFTCANGKCVVSHWTCDGNNDCGDNSDEENCPTKVCKNGEFMCKNDSSCILASWQCDGENDCLDKSDEQNCTYTDGKAAISRCGKLEFECGDHLMCIHKTWVCDGYSDCSDGSDEAESRCQRVICNADQFQCRNRECIPLSKRCTGLAECTDSSDEDNCFMTPEKICDPKTQFLCGNNECIPFDKVCDQKNDCGKWEDEPKDKCGKNECEVDNGGCSHLCIDTPASYYCECKPGYKLVDNFTCADINECEVPGTCSQTCTNEKGSYKCECLDGYLKDPKDRTRCKAVEGHASLLFALRRNIRKVSLDHLKMTLIVENTRSATALDYMFRTGMIYWSDGHDGKIYTAPIDEGDTKSVVIDCGLKTSDGLAIDWIYNHVYWTDSGKKTINVAELDGKMRKVLISDGLAEPRSIALNPLDGWMYWTDWGITPGKIERAGMDGSKRETIVKTDLKWPNGLTLDLVQSRLYWVDAKLNSISSSNFDGSNRRLILQSSQALSHPYSITTFEDYLYWTDWSNETIFKANKFNGKELTAILPPKTVKNVMSVHVYHAYRQPDGENRCTPLNGRCSHLCLPAPRLSPTSPVISCACPDGLVMSNDGQSCSSDLAHNRPEQKENEKNAPSSSHNNSISWIPPNAPSPERNNNAASADLANEVEPGIIPAKSGFNKHQLNENYSKSKSGSSEGGGGIGFVVVGILSATIILVIVVILIVYRNVYTRNADSMNFDNPVYRKTTTEDHHIRIEKTQGFHKSYPSTITEEHFGFFDPVAQEPLTNSLGVNEYV